MLDTLMVAHSVLAEIYQTLSTPACPPEPPDLAGVRDQLRLMVTFLDQYLTRAGDYPVWRAVIESNAFEDIVALLAQIEWKLQRCYAPADNVFDALSPSAAALLADGLYAAIAATAVLEAIGRFPLALKWAVTLDELESAAQAVLREIDGQILERFPMLPFSPEPARFALLLAVFFDCYQGIQQNHAQIGSPYDGLCRESWQRRFRQNRDYQPTGLRILCAYSSSLDYPMRLNTNWFARAMGVVAQAEGKTPERLSGELGDFLQAVDGAIQDKQPLPLPAAIKSHSDVLKTLLGYVHATGHGHDPLSKVRVETSNLEERWDLMDALAEITCAARGRVVAGGAAATGAQALAELGERDVDLLMPFVPSRMLDVFGDDLRILWYKDTPVGDGRKKALIRLSPRALKEQRVGPPHPEVHNYVIEFAPGAPIVYCPCCGVGVRPRRTDRVIVINRFGYYNADGAVDSILDRTLTHLYGTQLRVNGLFGFDSSINPGLSSADCTDLLAQATDRITPLYDLFIIAGLQSLDPAAHATAECELEQFSATGVKIHVEISGGRDMDWLAGVIARRKLYSVGCGEELEQLYQAACKWQLARLDPAESAEASLEQKQFLDALRTQPRGYQMVAKGVKVLNALGLQRLYIHDTDMDIIVRAGQLELDQRMDEIRADLVAKWVVLRKLMSRGQINRDPTRDTMTQVKESGLTALLETARAIYDDKLHVPPDGSVELYGANLQDDNCAVMLVPVRWVYGAMQDQLRVVGAGDTTSFISSVKAIKALLQRGIKRL